jgi:hypothetical protein
MVHRCVLSPIAALLSLPVAPSLDSRGLHDMRVEASERVKFCLRIQGEPTPDITWVKEGAADGETLETNRSAAITLTNTAEETKLVFNNITKEQQGTYLVTLSNASGKDSAKVSVAVLDRPTPPESLIATPEAEKNACSLLWKRSRDDGGAPIDYYQGRNSTIFKNYS